MLRIVGENRAEFKGYTREEIEEKMYNCESVVGKVLKCNTEDKLIVSLGEDLIGELSIEHFEDTDKEVPKYALISKVGKLVEAYITSIDDVITLDRATLQKEYKENFLKENLESGTILETTVSSIASFGLFVELGKGVIGLLPIDDIAISRLSNIKEVFKIGQSIRVVFIEEHSGLYVVSHKELLGTWEENFADFKVGEVVQGIVRDVKEFGVFIEIAPNLSGLADLPDFPILIGDSVSVLIKSITPEKMKLKLHIVGVTETPYEIKYNYKVSEDFKGVWKYAPEVSNKEINTYF